MSQNVFNNPSTQSGQASEINGAEFTAAADHVSGWRLSVRFLLPALLVGGWALVLSGEHQAFPLQVTSWLTFLALLVTPGYLLGELATWRLRLDTIERLALAFPLSIVVLSIPGMIALLSHQTIVELANGWMIASAVVICLWVLTAIVLRKPSTRAERWTIDQLIWLVLIGAAFILILPTLSLYKIDGDAYAVGSFTADAMARLPLNATEPLFGTDLGPGVRMAFNQSLPMAYLWSWFSGIDSLTLTATASRSMIALWSLLAAFTLGRAAGLTLPNRNNVSSLNSRRFALLVTSIQLLIFLAAPFLRGDNVSIFFFERTTADKFMVPMTMLPVVFAFTMRYLGSGKGASWLAAALVTFAVSTIHPLIAAMLALALGAFAGFHWLLNLRSKQAFLRTLAVGVLVTLVMVIPIVQLYLSRTEAPLASSYPTTMEGWHVGERLVPALPFVYLPSLEVYGPLPDLARLDAIEAASDTDPFLIWRFAVNMNRRRLILFDLDSYISDPNIMLEPPYLMALLLLPLLFWKIRKNLAAQFAVSTSAAILFVMFNPLVTPLIGSLVMPWILWRFVWMLPYALILALAGYRLLHILFNDQLISQESRNRYAPLAAAVVLALALSPSIANTLETMRLRAAFPYFYPTPTTIYEKLDELTTGSEAAIVLADQDLSVTLPAYVANANVIAHRVPTTSEIFPQDMQVVALQRLIDQETFFRSRYLTQDSLDILNRYGVDYIIAPSGSNLDLQLRLASGWFEHVVDDQSYSLYAVGSLPSGGTGADEIVDRVSESVIDGNSMLDDRLWMLAERHYRSALTEDPANALAMIGLSDIAHAQGRFNDAVRWINTAIFYTGEPALHYQLGQLYSEMGENDESLIEFESAQQAAPNIAPYNLALGDACLASGDVDCARVQFTAAVENGNYPDEVTRLTGLADLWRQRNMYGQALPLYEDVVARWPSIDNQLMLASAYLETDRFEQAEALLTALRSAHPLSTEAIALAGSVQAAQEKFDEAVTLFARAILLQEIQGKISTETSLSLVQTLIDADRLQEAQAKLDVVLHREPYSAIGHSLQGDLYLRMHQMEAAMTSYQQAFEIDPTQVSVYIAMTNEMRRQGGRQDHILELLERAIKANPDEAMLALAFGDQAERRGETDAAVDAYQSALDMFERFVSPGTGNQGANDLSRAYAYARLAGVSEDKGLLEPAMNYYRASVAAVADQPWPRVILGDALRRRGDIEGAIEAYEGAIAIDSQHLDSYMRLADLHTALGAVESADAYRREALKLAFAEPAQQLSSAKRYGLSSPSPLVASQANLAAQSGEKLADAAQIDGQGGTPQTVEFVPPSSLNLDDGNDSTLRLLAQIYRSDNHPQQAIDFYEQIIAAGKDAGWTGATLASYYKGLGDLYLLVDDPVAASEAYERAIALDNWWPQPRLGLARATADQGAIDIALQQLRETVEIAPGYVEAQVALAGALETDGQVGEALAIYEEIASTHAGNANATLAYGRALFDRGKLEPAEAIFRTTVEMNPGSSDAYVELASLLIDQARYEEARPLLKAALEIDQQNVNAYLQSGLLEQRSGNFEEALAWFTDATKLDTDSPSINITLIDLLQRSGHYGPAITYIKEQLEDQPGDVDLMVRLSSTLRVVGRYSEALAVLLQAEQESITDARLAADLGELYLAQGRPRAAVAAYQQAINLQPDERSYYLRGAEILRGQGEFMHAIGLLRRGLHSAAEPAALYAAMAGLYRDYDEIDMAKAALDQGIDAVGDQIEILLGIGDHRAAVEGGESAKEWYDTVLVSHPDEPALHVAVGNLALDANALDDAIASYEMAITLSPQEAAHHALLAAALDRAGRSDSAIAAYEQALLLEPTLIGTYTDLAALYEETGRADDARALLDRGMLIAPTDGQFYVAYSEYLMEHGEGDRALSMLAVADQIAPTTDMLVARANFYISQKRYDDALADLALAIKKEPGAIDAYLALSNAYQKKDDTKRAEQIIESLKNRFPGLGYTTPNKSG